MAKINPPTIDKMFSLTGNVAWTAVKEAGLLSLLELPRDVQIQIVQYAYPWFKPEGWINPKDKTYTKKWWDSLTGDQKTVRWALAFPVRCRKGYEDVPVSYPDVPFYDTVSEQNALAWYAGVPPHLKKSIDTEIAKLPDVLEAKRSDALYQLVAKVWGARPELPEDREGGIYGDEDFQIEVWREWARLYTKELTTYVIVKEAPRIQAERKMLSQALGLSDSGNGFPAQSDGLDDTQAATVRWIQNQGETPLEFLLSTYKDDTARMSDRITAAKTLMEYVHKRVPAKQEIETKLIKEASLPPAILKGLSDKELATLETLLIKLNKV